MGQPGSVYQVTDGVDTRKVGLHLFIDAHTSAVVIQTLLHQLLEAAGVGPAADGHQDILAVEGLFAFVCLGDDLFHITVVGDRLDFCSRDDVDATFGEDAHKELAYLIIERGQDGGQHLENCHFCAEPIEHTGQFHADHAATHANKAFRLLG